MKISVDISIDLVKAVKDGQIDVNDVVSLLGLDEIWEKEYLSEENIKIIDDISKSYADSKV